MVCFQRMDLGQVKDMCLHKYWKCTANVAVHCKLRIIFHSVSRVQGEMSRHIPIKKFVFCLLLNQI